MSHEGKLIRGAQYHDMRDRDGKLPKGVLNNPSKMSDHNYYIDSIEIPSVEKEETKKKKEEK